MFPSASVGGLEVPLFRSFFPAGLFGGGCVLHYLGFFRPRFLLAASFVPDFLRSWLIATRLFPARLKAPIFTPRLLASGNLNSAQGAPEVFNFTFVTELLFLSQFDQRQHFFHFLQRVLQGIHNISDMVHSFGDRRIVLFPGPLLLLRWWRSVMNRLPFGRARGLVFSLRGGRYIFGRGR